MTNTKTYRFQPDKFSQQELDNEDYRQIREEELSMRTPHEGLKRLRKKQNKSQAEMAEVLNVSRRSYQDFEAGKRPIPSDAILALHAEFDCDLHELFTGRPVPIPRKVRAGFVQVALDAVGALLQHYEGKSLSMDEIRRYATLVAELTPPGEAPEMLWMLEMIARERAGFPTHGFGDDMDDEDGQAHG